jgi:Eukaryotic protein of unknown function (DUF866)
MVLFVLQMKAETEGVRSVELQPGTGLCLSVRNPQSDYEVRDNVVIDTSEYLDASEPDAKEMECHLRIKWEGQPKASFLKILTNAEAKTVLKKMKQPKGTAEAAWLPRPYTANDTGRYVSLLLVECRGLEPYQLTAGSTEFVVTSDGGTVFDQDVNVADGDWADYDAEHDAPVALSEVEFQWQAVA